MSSRDRIRMSDEEALAFLDGQRTVICATNGRHGWPHLMPLWYVIRPSGEDGAPQLWAWTFAKSQKARNLERDARATLQVETGEEYDVLRGVMLRCEAAIHRDVDTVHAFGLELYTRYGGLDDEVRAMIDKQAPKRVALQFAERAPRVTWDHRKLATAW
jgi:Pyridoxamine 5'-phosphate oxidase